MLHLNVLKTSHKLSFFFDALMLETFSHLKEKQVLNFLSFLDVIRERRKYTEICDTKGVLEDRRGLVVNK